MNYFLNVLTELLIFPFVVLIISILCPKWKYSGKKTFFIIFAIILSLSVINVPIYLLYHDEKFYLVSLYLFNSLIIFLSMYLLCDIKLGIFIYIFVTSFAFEFFAQNIALVFEFCDIPKSASKLLIYIEIAMISEVLFRPIFIKTTKFINNDWLFRSFFPLVAILCFLTNDLFYQSKTFTAGHLFTSVIISFMLMVYYITTFRFFRLFVLANENALMQIKKASSSEYIKLQIDVMNEIDKDVHMISHDLRHSVKHLANMIENDEKENALNALQEFDSELDETATRSKTIMYTGFPPLDALLSYYSTTCSRKGISFIVELSCFERYTEDFSDISIVFTNALDNAVEAAEKSSSELKFVKIRDFSNGNNIVIEFSNTCTNTVNFDENGIPETNVPGHGFGLRSIRNIIETTFGGGIDCSLKGNVFTLRVFK